MTINSSPRFAIITPVFNSIKYLSECLDSLLSQTYKNFVVFLIDDGSTDGSDAILDKYAEKDSRFVVIHKRNEGVSSARNVALELIEKNSEFNYVCFLDSDDIWVSDCLETVCHHLVPNRLLIFGIQNFNKNGPIFNKIKEHHSPFFYDRDKAFYFAFDDENYNKSPAFSLFLGNVIVPTNRLQGIRFNSKLNIGEDQDFKIKILDKYDGIVVISNCLLYYRLRKNSLSHSEKFSTKPMHLAIDLTKQDIKFPLDFKKFLEKRAAATWWHSIRQASILGVLSLYFKEFNEALCEMRNFFSSDILETVTYKKRIYIFNIGCKAIKIYCAFTTKKSSASNIEDYFD